MQCTNCGSQIPDIAKFCPKCGATQEKIPLQKPKRSKDSSRFFIILMVLGVVVIGIGLVITLPDTSLGTSKPVSPEGSGLFTTPEQVSGSDGERSESIGELPTETSEPTPAEPRSTPTMVYTPTRQSSSTSTPTAITNVVEAAINPRDQADIVFVPSGEFLMGSDPDIDPNFWGAEGPQHFVYLDSYWIYRTEVTNAKYQECVAEQKCPRPVRYSAVNTEDYYENPLYADYPVIYVSFTHAAAYCHWAGGRLPTEAEWEKAARGTDAQLFPWGDYSPDSDQVNLCDGNCARGQIIETHLDDGYAGTSPVGSFPAGVSPFGAYDMAGNVWEWTFDWFDSTFYSVSPYENPNGPVSGDRHVIRGGSWSMPIGGVRVVARISEPPDASLDNLGFRCVIDVKE